MAPSAPSLITNDQLLGIKKGASPAESDPRPGGVALTAGHTGGHGGTRTAKSQRGDDPRPQSPALAIVGLFVPTGGPGVILIASHRSLTGSR